MTRRTWFATLAALFARKTPLAAQTARANRTIRVWKPRAVGPTATAVRVYSQVQYGLGIPISRELLEDDRYHQLWRAACVATERRRRKLDALCAEILFSPPD